MKVSSPAFEDHRPIPARFTCDGADVSPPLAFSGIPSDTKSIAIIVDDPDAPMGTFDHWIAWNLPPDTKSLPEKASVPYQGRNNFDDVKYRGPCPPRGHAHRYFFKIYALDAVLDLPNGSNKKQLEDAMKGHILDKAELVGTYQRP